MAEGDFEPPPTVASVLQNVLLTSTVFADTITLEQVRVALKRASAKKSVTCVFVMYITKKRSLSRFSRRSYGVFRIDEKDICALHGALTRQRSETREKVAESIVAFTEADVVLPVPMDSSEAETVHPQARQRGVEGEGRGERKGLAEATRALDEAERALSGECEAVSRELHRLEAELADAASTWR
jgi:hypothetical protein